MVGVYVYVSESPASELRVMLTHPSILGHRPLGIEVGWLCGWEDTPQPPGSGGVSAHGLRPKDIGHRTSCDEAGRLGVGLRRGRVCRDGGRLEALPYLLSSDLGPQPSAL